MFSKKQLRALLGCGLVLLNSSCGLKVGEKQPEPAAPSYSGRGLSCVGQIPQNVESYVNDRMSAAEISNFVQCLQKAFTSFAQLTRGRKEHSTYTPQEIREFLEEYFLKKHKISDKLLSEFMVVKQVLVGGELDRITRPELYLAVEFLEDIRVEAIRLKPHLRYLNPRLIVQQEPHGLGERLNEANDALKVTIKTISDRLQKSKKSYAFANLATLLSEFRAFVKWEDHFQRAVPVNSWVDFLRTFKQITVANSKQDVIHSSEWVPLLQSASRWYLSYLQYEIGVKNQPLLNGVGLQNLLHLAQEVFEQTEDAINHQPDRLVTYDQLKALTTSLKALGWLPRDVRVESLDQAVQTFISRIYGDPRVPPSKRVAKGLTLGALALMRHEFYSWAQIQILLDHHYHDTRKIRSEVPALQSPMNMIYETRAQMRDLKGSDWEDFIAVRKLMLPLFPDDQNRILLAPESDRPRLGVRHDFYNLSVMNLLRSLSAVVFRGYSEEQNLRHSWKASLRSSELQKFYQDFRDLGIDLKIMDRRNKNTGSRSFIEGKLFTYSSKGFVYGDDGEDSQLSMPEMMEFFAFLFSGGKMADSIYETLAARCPAGPTDLQCRKKLDRRCVIMALPQVLDEQIWHMPRLRSYYRSLETLWRQDYAETLLDSAFSPNSSKIWVEHSEIQTMSVILQYSEAAMTRFDADSDGWLTTDEVKAAEPIFQGFIQKFAKEKMGISLYDWMARAVFRGILAEKRILSLSGFYGEVRVNRKDLAEVFKVILSKLVEGESPAASKEEVYCPAR